MLMSLLNTYLQFSPVSVQIKFSAIMSTVSNNYCLAVSDNAPIIENFQTASSA